jgi:hypothetical protein
MNVFLKLAGEKPMLKERCMESDNKAHKSGVEGLPQDDVLTKMERSHSR